MFVDLTLNTNQTSAKFVAYCIAIQWWVNSLVVVPKNTNYLHQYSHALRAESILWLKANLRWNALNLFLVFDSYVHFSLSLSLSFCSVSLYMCQNDLNMTLTRPLACYVKNSAKLHQLFQLSSEYFSISLLSVNVQGHWTRNVVYYSQVRYVTLRDVTWRSAWNLSRGLLLM